MEFLISNEVDKFVQHMRPFVGQKIDIDATLNTSILSGLWVIITGETLELSDKKLKHVVELVIKTVYTRLPPRAMLFNKLPTPWKRVPGIHCIILWVSMIQSHLSRLAIQKLLGVSTFLERCEGFHSFLQSCINSHMAEYDPEHQNDMLDVLIHKLKTETELQSPFYGQMGRQHLLFVMEDFLTAGMETTASTLTQTIFFLLHHPQVQDKVHNEIVKVVFTDSYPTQALTSLFVEGCWS